SKSWQHLSEGWDMQIGDVLLGDMRFGEVEVGPIWSEDNQLLYFLASIHGQTKLVVTDLRAEYKIIYQPDGHIFSMDYLNGRFVLGISTPISPGECIVIDDRGQKLYETQINGDFKVNKQLVEPE